MSPQNARSMPDAHAEGSYGDIRCGDYMTFYIKVDGGIIVDVSYLVFGCSSAIASASITSVLSKGKTIDYALSLTDKDIENELGGLPPTKRHCSNLGVNALKSAIYNYNNKLNQTPIHK